MIAKQLEALLIVESASSRRAPADFVQRFQSLREWNLLSKGRGKNAEQLSLDEVAAGVLSVVSARPSFAGSVAKSLLGLKPVGGTAASFKNAKTFGEVIEKLIDCEDALDSLIEIRVSDNEIYTNAHGRAVVSYVSEGNKKTAFYVFKTVLSLMQPGAEQSFDPTQTVSPILIEHIFYPRLFSKIARAFREKNQDRVG